MMSTRVPPSHIRSASQAVVTLAFAASWSLLALQAQGQAADLTSADSWREFRGNSANGLALLAQLPTHWSEEDNCVWKTAIHGRGWSSPVASDGEVWLTTASEDGSQLSVLCIDFATGAIKHDRLLYDNNTPQPDHHATNTYASPTPILDEQHVYVHFGSYGTACLDRNTVETIWERRDLPCNHFRGPGSSPILYENKLIFHMDGFDFQYAIALDRHTGQTIWKVDRDIDYGTDNGDFYKAYSTPIIIQVGGVDQLISPASKTLLALNPDTGEEFWRVRYDEHSTTVRPLFDGERIYFSSGFSKAQMLCVRVDGQGDVTDTHVQWSQRKGIGAKPSPVLVAGRLFDVTDDGILERLDLETGEIVWKERLGGKFSASLLATKTHLYAFDHDGKGYVYTLGDTPQLVSENTLPSGCNASPAVIGDSLIVRTTTHLYRFENR
ncbi:outer membrane protein assembly factor BamB family protein [Aureliella helgolandensis]|uniref:Outer membrane biogenesis protein BamB n=1 Tax=Aureliella helgolandensis TaxID=2527968 RepID=A0A518G279_9BACT|nr:PQQ-binding-like beta-propeller repeat protein [Aureliella helgolandensis]QDV22716.1 outer membrane biogenesis protein BamB [Aureliella helgolandensis]